MDGRVVFDHISTFRYMQIISHFHMILQESRYMCCLWMDGSFVYDINAEKGKISL